MFDIIMAMVTLSMLSFFCADVIAGHRLSAELCSGDLDNLCTRQIVVGAPDTRVEKENYEIIVHDYSNLRGEDLSCEKNIMATVKTP